MDWVVEKKSRNIESTDKSAMWYRAAVGVETFSNGSV